MIFQVSQIQDSLSQIHETIGNYIDTLPGCLHQKMQLLEILSRQSFFTNFHTIVSDYWCGVATPFLNRAYARFCLSLPRLALDNRQLLAGVFRRYYGKLAVIPGTYAKEPYILTGKYLVKRRIVEHLPASMHHGPFAGFDDVPLRMDVDCIQANRKGALWPLFDAWDQLSEWLDVNLLEQAYLAVIESKDDIRH